MLYTERSIAQSGTALGSDRSRTPSYPGFRVVIHRFIHVMHRRRQLFRPPGRRFMPIHAPKYGPMRKVYPLNMDRHDPYQGPWTLIVRDTLPVFGPLRALYPHIRALLHRFTHSYTQVGVSSRRRRRSRRMQRVPRVFVIHVWPRTPLEVSCRPPSASVRPSLPPARPSTTQWRPRSYHRSVRGW